MINFNKQEKESSTETFSIKPIELILGSGDFIPENITLKEENSKQTLSGNDIKIKEDYRFREHDLEYNQDLIDILQTAGVIEGYTIEEGEGFDDAPGYSSDTDHWKHVETYRFNKPLIIEITKLNSALESNQLKIKT